jgi:hypothetical protein
MNALSKWMSNLMATALLTGRALWHFTCAVMSAWMEAGKGGERMYYK